MRLAILTLLLITVAGFAQALNPITIKGNKFFDSKTKKQFFIKGVAYQPRNGESHVRNNTDVIIDPLTDASGCQRDAALMKKLGLNVVRVYEVDPHKNHDACMKSFERAGIYLLLDIATPKFSINRQTPEYDTRLYTAYVKTVDAFLKYSNVLGFIAGNEVTNNKSNTVASAFVKAAVRDVKKYIRSRNKHVPVGYAGNDDEDIRGAIKDYFACGAEEEQADFFGVNMYEWCGRSSFQESGYAERTKEFESYSKPVFMSEYGCNLVTPRPFTEVKAIYGPEMMGVWSGGVVYEWSQEQNNYGLVQIMSDGKAKLLQDYHNLQSALANVGSDSELAESMETMDQIKTASGSMTCPEASDRWKAAATLPPTPSDQACNCMRDNLSCMVSDKVIGSAGNQKGSAVGEQIDVLCGMVSCDDISNDGEKGRYGAFAFCSPSEKLSYLYHLYLQNNKGGKCDFDGNAQVAKPKQHNMNQCSKMAPSSSSPSTGDHENGGASGSTVSSGLLYHPVPAAAASILWSALACLLVAAWD